jgi:hypothetical protein
MITQINFNSVRKLMAVVTTVMVLSGCGITAPRSNEGYANLDSTGVNDTNSTMALSLGPTTLRFAARFLDDEPETQALLRSLDGVRIRIYDVYGDQERITRNFDHMGGKLLDDGWDPVMLVQEEGELVQMYVKSSAEGVSGLTIVSADDEEVVVINVMGDIDPVYYTDVMYALNVDDAPEVQIAAVN